MAIMMLITRQVNALTLSGTVSQSAQWAVSSGGKLNIGTTDDPDFSLSMRDTNGSIPPAI